MTCGGTSPAKSPENTLRFETCGGTSLSCDQLMSISCISVHHPFPVSSVSVEGSRPYCASPWPSRAVLMTPVSMLDASNGRNAAVVGLVEMYTYPGVRPLKLAPGTF